ncbi:AI-2E family transporter [Coleofasciculus chthonoplastes]|uniref:AI-2E family transporter n=1 Tax=Coleofasciculus chthonoplastes TaxID=64178 RepID=UPI0008FEC4F9|nr:AI-2E family transporter [Coleofasciculus chthonoplastes]
MSRSIVAVLPPTLLALIFQGIGRGVATLVGLAIIQVILGNFVDPRLQGRTLKLSPFVALLSIVFWGWVWGIPGALLGNSGFNPTSDIIDFHKCENQCQYSLVFPDRVQQ